MISRSRQAILELDSLAFTLLRSAEVMQEVVDQGRSLDRTLEAFFQGLPSKANRGALQDLAYYGLRHLGRGRELKRALTGRAKLAPDTLDYLMSLSLSLLSDEGEQKYDAHTLVNQAVNACTSRGDLVQAKGLINGCLRTFLREKPQRMAALQKVPEAVYNCPGWWLRKLKQQHPTCWSDLLAVAQTKPPMVLRVNSRWGTPTAYQALLNNHGVGSRLIGEQGLVLDQPCAVGALPGFELGWVSVQDSAAQLAGPLLDLQNGMRVLDACAAPGGKTGHIVELADVHLVAVDQSELRMSKVRSNLERLRGSVPFGLKGLGEVTGKGEGSVVELKVAPVQHLSEWYDGAAFDVVLADVPCTGSGVIRRHPDIKWLRSEADVANLSHLQSEILDALWSVVKPGGTLLIVTCSVFSEEGPLLVESFSARHPQAQALPAPGAILPAGAMASSFDSSTVADGFYYAKFKKPQA